MIYENRMIGIRHIAVATAVCVNARTECINGFSSAFQELARSRLRHKKKFFAQNKTVTFCGVDKV